MQVVRIQNKNFGSAVREEKSSLLWIFVPSASIVAAAFVVLIFMFNGIGNEMPANQPKMIKNKSAQTYVVLNPSSKTSSKKSDEIDMVKILKTENDVVINKSVKAIEAARSYIIVIPQSSSDLITLPYC
jgi:hypothetical protein